MADQEFILAPPTVKVKFGLQPVLNTLNSFSLLTQIVDRSGFASWVEETSNALSPERSMKNYMILKVFHAITYGDAYQQAESFEDYIKQIADLDPSEARDRVANGLVEKCSTLDADFELDYDTLLNNKDAYLNAIETLYSKHYKEHGKKLDLDVYAVAHDLLSDPSAMLGTIVEQLRYMWENFLKHDWERNLPLLNESINAFKRMDFSNYTTLQAVRTVTGRDLSGYWDELDIANELTFVPSAHVGPYVSFYDKHDEKFLIFGARVPEGVIKSPALSRSEMLVRLNALADDTRLQILELLTETPELCAQDIINELELSQSSASRHLRQLTATGYLVERRREVAKCYTLNHDRFQDTLNALQHFLRNR